MGGTVSIIASVFSAVSSIAGAIKKDDRADANAERIEAETAEEKRRKKKQQEEEAALARAKGYASGAGGKSLDEYLSAMDEEFDRELSWLSRSGKSRSDIARSEGGNVGTTVLGAATDVASTVWGE